MKFGDVKVGDKVWLRRYGNGRVHLETVVKVTPTQIILKARGEGIAGDRYKRSNGAAIGYACRPSISAVAAPEEIETWEAERQAEKEESERRRAEQAALDAKREELNAALPGTAHVSPQDGGQWSVTVSWLSEEGVRKLARLLKANGLG